MMKNTRSMAKLTPKLAQQFGQRLGNINFSDCWEKVDSVKCTKLLILKISLKWQLNFMNLVLNGTPKLNKISSSMQ